MNKIRSHTIFRDTKYLVGIILVIFFILVTWLIINFKVGCKGYSFFIEFDNAHGIQEGTPLRLRGINIGNVKEIKMELNAVLTLAHINSALTLIPRNSVIETNQTGLLNEAVIDIIPLDIIYYKDKMNLSPLSKTCNDSMIVCNATYLEGDRGLNYDDLVRATTRISQRFDDPRFFNLLYVFLQNGIELSDGILDMTANFSDIIAVIYFYLQKTITSN
uniref:hypothetical protein n=1 Tax=Ahnfeltia fastigiata TaxID=31363 RepID=UPI001D111D89|nr:hypothetical protein LK038_pgp188 [Ahnfeltia fastigiata]UAT97595.1 hypothetical protein Ahn.fas.Ore.pt_023 [Ahnfeltia fastigiata]UAT97799.1 hypothetical protein Ahn.fas.Kor.pt_023 [Ahnfeltia fastigiata]